MGHPIWTPNGSKIGQFGGPDPQILNESFKSAGSGSRFERESFKIRGPGSRFERDSFRIWGSRPPNWSILDPFGVQIGWGRAGRVAQFPLYGSSTRQNGCSEGSKPLQDHDQNGVFWG